MSKIITLTKATAEDYRRLVFFHIFLRKRIMLYFLIFAGVVSIAVAFAKLSGLSAVADWYLYVCLAFLGLALLQYLVFRFTVKRFIASDKVVIDNERSVAIDESGIAVEGGKENSSATYRWDMFYNAYDTKNYFYLYINTAQAVILPKRDFRPEELPVLETLIREKLGEKFHKR